MRPAMRIAIMIGASSRAMEIPTSQLTKYVNPRSTIVGPVCNASTPPMKKDNTATMSRLALPISKNCSKTFSRCRQTCGSARNVRQKSSTISPMFWNMRGIFLRLVQRQIKQPPMPFFGGGFILKKTEKERAFSRRALHFATIKIPEQRLRTAFGIRILLAAPETPERRIIAFNALARGKNRLEQRQHLEARTTVEFALMRE